MSSGSLKLNEPERFYCRELRGGNQRANYSAELPGLECWVSCRPLRPSTKGGDVYYLSVCSQGAIARITLADVAGHGEVVSAAAVRLRDALREHSDDWDQTSLIQKLSDTFLNSKQSVGEYATAFVIGYSGSSGELVFTNAGHPLPVWYQAATQRWLLVEDQTLWSKSIANLPLGIIEGTPYTQTGLELAEGDLFILYTDGISEAEGVSGTQLGMDGLLELVRALPVSSPAEAGSALIAGVELYRGSAPAQDDETVIVLRRSAMRPAPVLPEGE
jgi:sigma-B regulation protein RsbU (phosphoserine phosphatase)